MTIKVGDKIPEGTLAVMGAEGPAGITTADIFSGKKEVVYTFKKANYSPELTKKEVEKRSNGKIEVELSVWQGEVTGVNYIIK